jgi:Mrp family chromosome partitioning ATPase
MPAPVERFDVTVERAEPLPEPVDVMASAPDADAEPVPEAEPVAEPETEPAPVVPGLGEIDVADAAEKLIAGGATRALFVSPEGDEAAATAVLVAREVADAGLRVLLLDLTASGAASRPMLDSSRLPGITNLLASEAQFTDVIHADHYSDCHVIPVGTADPVRAMRAADRLPIILESLTTAYDVVIVECGPADAESIRRLVAEGTEILVSVLSPADEVLAARDDLKAGGYGAPTLVTPEGSINPRSPVPGRSAA